MSVSFSLFFCLFARYFTDVNLQTQISVYWGCVARNRHRNRRLWRTSWTRCWVYRLRRALRVPVSKVKDMCKFHFQDFLHDIAPNSAQTRICNIRVHDTLDSVRGTDSDGCFLQGRRQLIVARPVRLTTTVWRNSLGEGAKEASLLPERLLLAVLVSIRRLFCAVGTRGADA